MLMSIYLCAQWVRHAVSLELNLFPGVLVMHLSQHTSVIFDTISLSIAFCFSCWSMLSNSGLLKDEGSIGRRLILESRDFRVEENCLKLRRRFALCSGTRTLNIVNPLAYMSVGVFLLHMLLTWLVVYIWDFGLIGAALALSFSWWLLVLLNSLYILFSPSCKETWTGFSRQAFSGIWPYFRLTVASAVMLCLEIWYSQGLVLIAGLLPNPTISLDSISICMNYLTWDICFMLGLAAAASVRVSNELGSGHPKVAKFSVFVVNGTSVIISIVFSAIVLIFKVALSKLFTSDTEVIAAVSELTPLLAISVLLNGIQPILSGVAIGSGWQGVVAYVNLTAYYIIGLPVGCVLGFKTSLGVAGIWWGLILGVLLQTITLIILTARTNWDAEVEKAVDRVKKSATDEASLIDNM